MKTVREVIFYKDYFDLFFEPLTEKLKNKIDDVLFMITILERIPARFLKNIEGPIGLYEIRIEYGSNIYRIFCCFDKGNMIVLFNGFQKKTQKTPAKELKKAGHIMKAYFNEQKTTGHGRKK